MTEELNKAIGEYFEALSDLYLSDLIDEKTYRELSRKLIDRFEEHNDEKK